MGDEQQRPRSEGKAFIKDIAPVLKGWDYEAGAINVRKVSGIDGSPKLQMRLDLGLLQMELTGRPDGRRPHGCESLLDYFEKLLADHKGRHDSDMDFQLSANQCQSLREEAVQYYQRYLSLFVLEDFEGVVRDTQRNLRVLDMCGQFAADEQDRMVLEQYRPYIVMMNARAKASLAFNASRYAEALRIVEEGLANIKDFFERFGHEEAYKESNEVRVLKRFARDIRRKLPVDPVARLRRKLEKAIKDERYEEAADLRDKLAAMDQPGQSQAKSKLS
jgi:tetratricopeptide (TPR) repeat protein